MRTPPCQLLGIEQPIGEAPMSAVPQLDAAVSNAGALGMLALSWSTPAGAGVRETATLTDRPFGGDFILASEQHRRLDEALEGGIRIVSLVWADPGDDVDQVNDVDGLVLHTVGSVDDARRGRRRPAHRGIDLARAASSRAAPLANRNDHRRRLVLRWVPRSDGRVGSGPSPCSPRRWTACVRMPGDP